MNHKYCILLFSCWLAALAFAQDAYTQKLPEVVVALTVLDELGEPVEKVDAQASDYMLNQKVAGRFCSGVTDANGNVEFVLKALAGVGIYVEKNGYYVSMAYPGHQTPIDNQLRFDPFIDDGIDRRGTTESPPMKKRVELKASIVMREKKNPTALYVRRVNADIPARDVWLGYDLIIGDWLEPYGRGKSSDLQFRSSPVARRHKQKGEMETGVLEVNFGQNAGFVRVNEENGWLAVSKLNMPHEAPEEGYAKEILKIEKYPNGSCSELKKAKGYFFRCRAQFNGEELVSARYGKILGRFEFSPYIWDRPRSSDDKEPPQAFGKVNFVYYLNPKANERNLEFDLEKNLFKNLNFSGWIENP